MAPVRRWNYEFFVIQHIVTYAGFLAAVYLHLPAEVKVWVWLPIGFVVLDRTLRSLNVLHTNILIFRPTARRQRFWASKATFQPLDSETTRIVILNPPIKWTAGQHVLLSCHTIAPLQSHPFTIASIPSDGRMEFLVKSKSGGTKRYLRHAEKLGLPVTEALADFRQQSAVTIEGPYGRIRPMKQFDSVMLIAGSSGGTFTIPLLRDIVQSWRLRNERPASRWSWATPNGAATRYLRCVWVVKSRAQYIWFSHQLVDVVRDVEELRSEGQDVDVDISIYVTCDEDFVSGSKEPQETGCGTQDNPAVERPHVNTDKSQEDEKLDQDIDSLETSSTNQSSSETDPKTSCGPNGTCCCQTVIEDEEAISDAAPCECHCGTATEALPSEEEKDKFSSPPDSAFENEKSPSHSGSSPPSTTSNQPSHRQTRHQPPPQAIHVYRCSRVVLIPRTSSARC